MQGLYYNRGRGLALDEISAAVNILAGVWAGVWAIIWPDTGGHFEGSMREVQIHSKSFLRLFFDL